MHIHQNLKKLNPYPLGSLAEPAVQMVILSGTATVLQQFVSGLKSRNEDTRAKSAKDLQHYVTTELREVIQMFLVNVLSFHFIGHEERCLCGVCKLFIKVTPSTTSKQRSFLVLTW